MTDTHTDRLTFGLLGLLSQPKINIQANYERSVRIKAATQNVLVLSQASATMKAKVLKRKENNQMETDFLEGNELIKD